MGNKVHNYVWLMTEREFTDFELRLKFQAFRDSPGNSGVQFRSRFDEMANGGCLDGPQVDINPPPESSWRTGLIYDETRGEQRWVFPSLKDWCIGPEHKLRSTFSSMQMKEMAGMTWWLSAEACTSGPSSTARL
jgi:hypothetical protein